MKIGDKVRTTIQIREYPEGTTGEVVRIEGTAIVVKFETGINTPLFVYEGEYEVIKEDENMKFVVSIRHADCTRNHRCSLSEYDVLINTEKNPLQLIEDFKVVTQNLKRVYNTTSVEELDTFCEANYRNFVPTNIEPFKRPNKILFIKTVRDQFSCGLRDAKNAVERCKPFMKIADAYQQYYSVIQNPYA